MCGSALKCDGLELKSGDNLSTFEDVSKMMVTINAVFTYSHAVESNQDSEGVD